MARRKPKSCKECGRWMGGYLAICANCDRVRQATKNPDNIKLRQTVITALGGKCNWCGEDRLGCLDVDHVDGDGPSHRRELEMQGYKSNYAIYNYLIDNAFKCSVRLQLLCRACHTRKHTRTNRYAKVKILMKRGVLCN